MTHWSNASSNFSKFQSTHLHEVWLFCASSYDFWYRFNPHTYMRCDIIIRRLMKPRKGFNPHTYMRCDLVASAKVPHTKVSIHTPTWGVTRDGSSSLSWYVMFQSTHLHEVWQFVTEYNKIAGKFQSTHLHEVWPSLKSSNINNSLFQSTHLHEVWPYFPCWNNISDKFQSTHLHEVWPFFNSTYAPWLMFQSTHLHEVWPYAG